MPANVPLNKINIFIQAPPRTGKSTLIDRICSILNEKGYKVGGIVTPEIKEKNRRIGFWVRDLSTGNKEILAHINIKSMFKVSKYGVDVDAFDGLAFTAINSAIDNCDLIVIDEIGKMELFSEKFQKIVKKGLNSNKPVVGTMGVIDHPFVRLLKSRSDLKVLTLNRANMEYVNQEICKFLGLRII